MFPTSLGYLIWSNTFDHTLFNAIGIIVSLYALYIEIRKHKDPQYVAMCDLNEHMSCSRVLTSRYGTGFGFVEYLVGKNSYLNQPNCIVGAIMFFIQIVLGQFDWWLAIEVNYYCSIIACLGCFYLAIVLFFILKDLCLVCISMYICNAAIFYLNYQRHLYAAF
ncbi:unnamed protein product [Owenia fusiformis]|uniref:vitamin-K-epoxide reductase (warfarin-sensitive) n=1 Tax=Owenia fusiformis TaxID=6347 RepID=A0A8J1XJT4_OWEFU|nr:unnamed protein product [Owenia fusiformis]